MLYKGCNSLPELTSEKLQAFWKAVKAARVMKGMTLDQAAFACFGRDNAKGYFSQIENGKRQITPRTAGKIITALEMDAALLAPFLGKDEIIEDEVTKADTDAERLLEKAQAENAGSVTGERLLIDLAYDFAEGHHDDLFTAYKGLRAALEAARELKTQGSLPQNISSQLDAVLRRVSEMNEVGDRDGAAEYLASEEKRLDAEAEALFNAQLKQDRVRNRPDLSAKRLYKLTSQKAHEAGEKRFLAIYRLTENWRRNGDTSGDLFSLQVALELAKRNKEASGGANVDAALNSLGWCLIKLAERSTKDDLLKAAQNVFELALKRTDSTKYPLVWGEQKSGLAVALARIGERNFDELILRDSVSAFRASLAVAEKHNTSDIHINWSQLGTALRYLGEITNDPVPLEEAVSRLTSTLSIVDKANYPLLWRTAHVNLGVSLRWLGSITKDMEKLHQARDALGANDTHECHEEAPMLWAMNQWNIADLASARFAFNPDPALIVEAREYVMRAHDFFGLGSEYQTLRCKELIARINAIEVAA